MEIEEQIINKCFDKWGRYISHHKSLTSEETEFVNSKYLDSLSFKESLYRIKLNIDIHPKCPICGKPVQVTFTPSRFFKKSCGNKLCENKIRQINVENTIKGKYGVSCVFSNNEIREKTKQTLLEKYGVDSITKSEKIKEKIKNTCLEKYGVESIGKSKEIREKIKNTCLEKYGVENPYQIKEVIDKIQEKRNDKMDIIKSKLSKAYNSKREWRIQRFKEGFIEKYGVDNPSKVPEIIQKSINTRIKLYGHLYNEEQYKETCLEKYGVSHPMKTEENRIRLSYIGSDPVIQQKKYNTMKRNHSFTSTKAEDRMYEELIKLYDKDDIKRQYKDLERYPFMCDFYIKSKDLFIECNFYYTHGEHKFDINSIEDQIKLNEIKEKIKETNKQTYKNILKTWTIRDIKKFNKAKENNLNYLIFYTEKEMIKWIENELKNN